MYFLGIDASTTATKALLIDADGAVVGVAAAEYGYATPRPLWSEQDPALWWDGAAQSVRAVLQQTSVDAGEIAAVGLTGQMHGLVLLDAHGAVLRPAILWNDQRTQAQCDEIHRRVGRERNGGEREREREQQGDADYTREDGEGHGYRGNGGAADRRKQPLVGQSQPASRRKTKREGSRARPKSSAQSSAMLDSPRAL